MLDKTVIDSAVDKRYTDFSGSIKQELMNKLASHPDSQAYAAEYDRIQDMKSAYADIVGATEED